MRRISAGIAASSVLWFAYIWWGHWGDVSAPVWVGSTIALGLATLAAVVPDRYARVHLLIPIALLLTLASFAAMRAVGAWPFAWDAFASAPYAGFLAAIGLVVSAGLLRGKLWARWAAFAWSAGSGGTGLLNSIGLWRFRDESTWLAGIGVVGAAVAICALMRPEVKARFGSQSDDGVWQRRDRFVSLARAAAVAGFMAATMLLLYGFGQSVAPQTNWSALALSPLLFVGSSLVVVRRSTVGLLLLGLGGILLIAQTVASFGCAPPADLEIVAYYAAFWGPSGLLGIAAAIGALRRL